MVADGFPYQARGSWTENPEGGLDYTPNPNNFGAHELSPNFTENPYSHYEKITGMSPEDIPRPNANNTNLNEVVAGIRRTIAKNGGAPGGKGPGGGMGTGAEARSPLARDAKGRFSSKPEPEPFDPARPLAATAAEPHEVMPPGEAAPVAAADAAPEAAEATAPLSETTPADALGNPEPAPEAAVLADDPPPSRKTYNEFDTSKKAVEFRANEKDPQGLYNVAVFEYVDPDSGNLVMEAFKSEGRFKPHSEKVGLRKLLGERKITPDQIKRVYSEHEPCELPGNYCGRPLKREIPDTPVFHSFEYGGDRAMAKVEAEASRQRGNDALAKALDSIFGGSQ